MQFPGRHDFVLIWPGKSSIHDKIYMDKRKIGVKIYTNISH